MHKLQSVRVQLHEMKAESRMREVENVYSRINEQVS